MIGIIRKGLGRIWPKTLERQFLAVLILVLTLAQFINLALLVGERKIVSRSSVYRQTLDITVTKIESVHSNMPSRLPYEWMNGLNLPGAYFLSDIAPSFNDTTTVKQPRLEQQLSNSLKRKNLDVLSIHVLLQINGPAPNLDFPPPPGRLSRLGGPSGPRRLGGPNQMANLGGSFGPIGMAPPHQNNLQELRDAPFQYPLNLRPAALPINLDTNIEELLIAIKVKPDIWFYAMVPFTQVEAITWRMVIATASLMLLTLCAAALFFRKISRPLTELTLAANRLGRGDSSGIIDETGPEDIQMAAIAFNTMQRRLSRTLETQRTMLHAIGHDLRTPLAALRIRAERVADTQNKKFLISSIDEMSIMTQEILSWAEDMSGTEELASVNLTSLVQSLCHDYTDQGLPVEFTDGISRPALVRRVALRRALRNIIDNAITYGDVAHIAITSTDNFQIITIEDEGAGIAQDDIANALKPFIRLETSRSKSTGGTGLGLPIAQSIIQANGGRLQLSNRASGGLCVRVFIPA